MDNNIKHQIVTLSNGDKYFVLEELNDGIDTYNFVLNIDDEKDIEIVKQTVVDSKLILKKLNDSEKIKTLSNEFKNIIDENQKKL